MRRKGILDEIQIMASPRACAAIRRFLSTSPLRACFAFRLATGYNQVISTECMHKKIKGSNNNNKRRDILEVLVMHWEGLGMASQSGEDVPIDNRKSKTMEVNWIMAPWDSRKYSLL